jgi:membrane associated rhomboid family serine protease
VIGEWWVVNWFLGMVVKDSGSHVAYVAHLGGFAAGMVLIMLFAKREREPVSQLEY